ncbi:Doublesex- and mab-3-related transcription factor 3 [Acromyrmex echinatior]|uniref:Doublesex-and mab-3-related transcription factor 3 n=1 Tax=Acromyrmex echinatior TaxID=103372 RepID=F4WF81_ACREC|nr:Doublesex- and mab-3-related transcription factor 3 [Acromyrmex echinatior]
MPSLSAMISIAYYYETLRREEKAISVKRLFHNIQKQNHLPNSSITIENPTRTNRPEKPPHSHSITLCRTSLPIMISSLIRNKLVLHSLVKWLCGGKAFWADLFESVTGWILDGGRGKTELWISGWQYKGFAILHIKRDTFESVSDLNKKADHDYCDKETGGRLFIHYYSASGMGKVKKRRSSVEIPRTETGRKKPMCGRCEVHGVIVLLEGHKMYCKFQKCTCDDCYNFLMQQRIAADNIARKRANKLSKEKKISHVEIVSDAQQSNIILSCVSTSHEGLKFMAHTKTYRCMKKYITQQNKCGKITEKGNVLIEPPMILTLTYTIKVMILSNLQQILVGSSFRDSETSSVVEFRNKDRHSMHSSKEEKFDGLNLKRRICLFFATEELLAESSVIFIEIMWRLWNEDAEQIGRYLNE